MFKVAGARFVLVVLAALTLVVGIAPRATAQESTPTVQAAKDVLAFAFYPSNKKQGDYFDPTIDAGKKAKLTVVLGNTGNIEFAARTSTINAGTAPNGGFLAANPGTKPDGVTTWVDYPEKIFTLTPGKGVEIPFTITVPKGTAPGQYITALSVETAEARAVQGSTSFKQVIRQVVPVFITVPGPLNPKFEIGKVTLDTVEGGAVLRIEIKNSGNVRVKPTGTVVLDDASGANVLTAPIAMDSVYARDETTLSIGIPALPGGTYSVKIDVTDPDTGAKASISDAAVTAQAPASPVPASPVSFSKATATPQPSLDKIQFLDVSVTITNTGEPLTNARLTLSVIHDGKAVEDYPLSASLALPAGDTVVASRYIPATGWSSGSWTFSLKLEKVDPTSGVATVLAVGDLGGPITIP